MEFFHDGRAGNVLHQRSRQLLILTGCVHDQGVRRDPGGLGFVLQTGHEVPVDAGFIKDRSHVCRHAGNCYVTAGKLVANVIAGHGHGFIRQNFAGVAQIIQELSRLHRSIILCQRNFSVLVEDIAACLPQVRIEQVIQGTDSRIGPFLCKGDNALQIGFLHLSAQHPPDPARWWAAR